MAEEEKDADPQKKDLDVGEYVESFSALKDSFLQGRDLKKQQRELEGYASETSAKREEHADRVNILENFDALVAEQEEAISTAREAIDAAKPQLEETSTNLAAAQGKLEAMKSEHKSDLATVKARNDKNVSSLSKVLADAKEARKRAEEQYKATTKTQEGVASEQAERFKQAFDEARLQEREANDALKDAKAAAKQLYRDKKQACEDAERPLSDEIAKLKAEQRRFQTEIEQRNKEVSAAQERLEYCRAVMERPEATDELKSSIEEREDVEGQMKGRIEELSATQAQSKESSRKARIVVVVALVILIAIVVAVIVAMNR